MKINNNLNPELIKYLQEKHLLDHLGKSQSQKTETTRDFQEIDLLLSKVDSKLARTISQIFTLNQLPLEKETLLQLISLLQGKSAAEKETLIKAFAFLAKAKLPLLPSIIKGIAANLRLNNNTYEDLPYAIELQEPASKIAEKLINLPAKIRSSLLNEQLPDRAVNQLLGQQLLNHYSEKILLSLFLPFHLPQYEKPIPSYLQIREEKATAKAGAKTKEYQINFCISLPKRGMVLANLIYQQDSLRSFFQSDNPATLKLIQQELPYLKERMAQLGLSLAEPQLSQLQEENYTQLFDSLLDLKTEPVEEMPKLDIRI